MEDVVISFSLNYLISELRKANSKKQKSPESRNSQGF